MLSRAQAGGITHLAQEFAEQPGDALISGFCSRERPSHQQRSKPTPWRQYRVRRSFSANSSAGSAAGVLGGLQYQGLSRLLLLPDGCEGDHAELATPSSGALARAQAGSKFYSHAIPQVRNTILPRERDRNWRLTAAQ